MPQYVYNSGYATGTIPCRGVMEFNDQVQTTPTGQNLDHDTHIANDPSQTQENTFLEGETAVVS